MKLKKQHFSWLYPLLAFLIPFVGLLAVMWVRGFVPFGDTSMLYSDMYHQYYPFFVSFRRALLSGDSLLFNWDVGMGLNYLSLIAYYLASPLNLLSVFVPEAHLLDFFSLLVPIKLGFAGLFFALFLKRMFHRNDLSIALFGAFYGLCAWALAYQWNLMWLDSFALLPLVVLGAISLLRDKKVLLYTITLFLSVLSNYYIGLFTCIFVALVFICYQICTFNDWERFFRDLGRIALFSVLAIGMTAFLELPAFMALRTTQSGINTFPTGFQLNIADSNTWTGLFDAMRQVAGNANGGLALNFKEHTGLPNLYCGVISVILSFLYLTCKQIKIREKLCSIGLLLFLNISFILRQLDYMWHGFHFTNMIPYRFSFLYSFVILYMAYRAYTLRRTFKVWQVGIAGALAVCLLLCSIERADATFWIYNIAFIVLYLVAFLVPYFYRKPKGNARREDISTVASLRKTCRFISSFLLLGIMGIELIINLVCFGIAYTGVDIRNYPEGGDYSRLMFQYMHERSSGDPFYRTEVTQAQTLNDGALNGYYGITTFTSSANVKVTRFTQALGLAAKDTYNRYCFEEGSPVANLFLNLRYMMDRQVIRRENAYFTEVHHFGNTALLENNAYLPLGFLTDPQLLNIDFETAYKELDATYGNWNNLAFQNKLFRAATGVEENVWNMVTGNHLNVSAEGTTLNDNYNANTQIYQTPSETGGTVTYRYIANQAGYACLDLYIGLYSSSYNPTNHYSVWKNGIELGGDYYSLPQVLGVANVVPGDVIELKITCYSSEHGLINAHCGILNEEIFRQGYNILNTSTLDITSFKNTEIQGKIDCHQSGVLFTSIPQDGNWTAIVDGKPVDVIAIGDAMVGILLSKGHHTITFTYKNHAFSVGLLVSLLSVIAFVAVYIPIYKKKS